MPILDMRPTSETLEEKQPVDETEEETTSEVTSDLEETVPAEAASNEDETSEKTDDAVKEDTVAGKTEEKQPWDVDALKAEREKVLSDLRELRKERRQAREETATAPLFVDKHDELADVAEQDVQLIERVLKAKGYVKKEDVQGMSQKMNYQEKLDSVKDKWLETHPEYLPENDPDDTRWNNLNRTMEEYGFKAPSRPQQIQDLLDFAHSRISGKSLPVKTKASIEASKERISSSSKGGNVSGAQVSRAPRSHVDTSVFVGFTEEELRELTS